MKLKVKFAYLFILVMSIILTSVLSAVNRNNRGVPTVNGLFHGDGDYNNYYFLAENDADFISPDTGLPVGPGRAYLWYYIYGDTMYILAEVDSGVNDNVFGWSKQNNPDRPYNESAGWKEHTAEKLIGSDNLGFEFSCGTYTYTWQQGYAYSADDQNPDSTWYSSYLDPDDGSGAPPPGTVSSSSFAYSMNNTSWDVTLGDPTRNDNTKWKSVDGDNDNDVTDEGWNGYNSTYDWEWAMIYEMKFDISYCGSDYISFQVVNAHNSPSKDTTEDVPFDSLDIMDLGDIPDTYPTYKGSDGPRHYIILNNPYLGASVDAETDGQPDITALGDDTFDYHDDEDGVIFDDPFTPGMSAQITITASVNGYLNAWMDFNCDGDFADSLEHVINETDAAGYLTAGTNYRQISVPSWATADTTYCRFRFTSDQQSLSYSGLATNGEVEDYIVYVYEDLCSLGDYVWEDLDQDGYQDGTEPGVYWVLVNLYEFGNPNPIATTHTNQTGYYLFDNLAPGTYYVEFIAPGWTFTIQDNNTPPADDTTDSDANPSTGLTGFYTLTAGQHNPTVDAGIYGGEALPVTLTTFHALFMNNLPVLNWVTQSETDNAYWNIYRSVSQNLGQAVQVNNQIIEGAGTTSQPTEYSYIDESLFDYIQQYGLSYQQPFWYWLESVTISGISEFYGPVDLVIPQEQFLPTPPAIPNVYGLYQNYPNPFNPNTEISFNLQESSYVDLIIYNMKGEVVKQLVKNEYLARDQYHRYSWDATDSNGRKVASGLYLYVLRTPTQEYVRKMILFK